MADLGCSRCERDKVVQQRSRVHCGKHRVAAVVRSDRVTFQPGQTDLAGHTLCRDDDDSAQSICYGQCGDRLYGVQNLELVGKLLGGLTTLSTALA